jgi:hypothetical protein
VTTADLRALIAGYRVQSEAVGIAVLAIVISLVLGTSARRQGTPLRMERDRLHAAQREVTTFRAAFKPTVPGEEAARLPDTLAVGVLRDSRISLAQRIAQQAERGGLRDVRVKFAAADTTSPPPAPQMFGTSISLAPYTLVVEGDGGFATALSLIKQLPPAVALQRMSVNRLVDGAVHYTLVLAVFETAEQSQHG